MAPHVFVEPWGLESIARAREGLPDDRSAPAPGAASRRDHGRGVPGQLARMWAEAEATGNEVVGVEPLAAMKLTNRDKDYAVVGELARLMPDPGSRFLYSRSSRDLIQLAREYPAELPEAIRQWPLLARIAEGREVLEDLLDRERRMLIRANEERLARYRSAAESWAEIWPDVQRRIEILPLLDAHRLILSSAEGVLPFEPTRGGEP